jgi:serine/threonine protein kinase
MELMTGGKIVGQGTYGCVFQPPLLCKKKKIPRSKVGKLTSERDIKPELDAYDTLSKIKDYQYYFLLPEKDLTCVPKILENQIDNDLSKCDFIKEANPDEKVFQLAMPYGGRDLYSVSLSQKEHIDFFQYFKHLLEAGSLMLLNGFIHFDIYSKNILVDKHNIPRLIDYGQSFLRKDISLETIFTRWKVLKPENSTTEPPEITFLTAMYEPHHYSFEDTVRYIMPQKKIFNTIEKVLGVPVKTQINSLANFFKTSVAFQNRDYEKFWRLYYTGFDSWSIGVLFVQLLNKLIYSYNFIESSEWKLKKRIVLNILRKMTSSNPKERIDCVEALAIFDPFNSIYQEYGIEWVERRREQRK